MSNLLRTLTGALAALVVLALPATAAAFPLIGVTDGAGPSIVLVDSAAPSTILETRLVQGLQVGDEIIGLDVHPKTGQLLALTKSTSALSLRELDLTTATLQSGVALDDDPTDLTSPYAFASLDLSDEVAFDVNPFNGLVRIIATASDSNLRVNATTGLVTTDGDINPAAGSTISGAAYANNVHNAAITTLYVLNDNGNSLAQLNPPNNGTVALVGFTGVVTGQAFPAAFDIAPGATSGTAIIHNASRIRAFDIDLMTGAATQLGEFATGRTVFADVTHLPNVVRIASAPVVVREDAGSITVTLSRLGAYGSTTVDFAATGTAATATDISTTTGQVTFAAGEVTKTITLPLVNDATVEDAKSLVVTVTRVAGAGIQSAYVLDGTTNPIVVTDDDATVTTVTVQPPSPLAGRCANQATIAAGDDSLTGTSAGDLLRGGRGDDTLTGLAGQDCLFGGLGADWLAGGADDDDLRGEGGTDQLRGGPGNDTLGGGAGNDVIFAGAGNDKISGDAGRDTIDAGAGDDTITVAAPGEVVNAGAGNDTINAADRGTQTIVCGLGRDTVKADIVDKLVGCERVTRASLRR